MMTRRSTARAAVRHGGFGEAGRAAQKQGEGCGEAERKLCQTHVGTPGYASPEVMQRLYPNPVKPQDYVRMRNRLWTQLKTGL